MAKSTSLSDFIDTVGGKGDRLTWDDTAFTVDLSGLGDRPEMLAAARHALDIWEATTGFTFKDVVDTSQDPADLVFDNELQGAYAQNSYYINGSDRGYFRSFINVAKDFQDGWPVDRRWGVGDYGVQTFIHEIGHAFGLRHPGDYNASTSSGSITYEDNAIYAMDTYQYSVMSYFNQHNYGDASFLFTATPMIVDFAAMEELYGPLQANLGNTSYGTSGLYDFSIAAAFTISDTDGIDTIDLRTYTQGARLDLNAGAFSDVNGYIKNLAIAFGTVIENAFGGSAGDRITGNGAANVLHGQGGNDTLDGGAGNDRLDGGDGADRLVGGQGNDTFIVDNAGDLLYEDAGTGSGTDKVLSSVSYKLRANIENLELTGVGSINGTGNASDNEIVGNDGNNKLNGGAGADRLDGGKGNDTYTLDDSGDQVIEFSGNGSDTILSMLDYYSLADAPNVERLQLVGNAVRAGGGNANDILIGNGIVNELNGGLGNDKLTGGLGADTFVFDTALGRTNVDKIMDFTAGEDTIRLGFDGASELGHSKDGDLLDGVFADITDGTAQVTETTRLLYHSKTGTLSYDADGSGKGKAISFVVLDNAVGFTADDILVIPMP